MGVTFQFVAIVAFGGLIVGLTTSLLTAKKYPGVTFASASYAMPVAIASAAASVTFRMIPCTQRPSEHPPGHPDQLDGRSQMGAVLRFPWSPSG